MTRFGIVLHLDQGRPLHGQIGGALDSLRTHLGNSVTREGWTLANKPRVQFHNGSAILEVCVLL